MRRFWHVPCLDKTFQTVARAVWPQGSKFVLRQSFFGQKSREDGTFSLPIIILSFAQYGKETENRKVGDIKCLENGYWYIYWLEAITSKHHNLKKPRKWETVQMMTLYSLTQITAKRRGKNHLSHKLCPFLS